MLLFDFDLDGRHDIFAANGHVADDIEGVQQRVTYAQPPHLFRNMGNRRFESVTENVGADFGRSIVGRGAAYGDYDGDGDLDLLLTVNNGPARLLRNDGGSRNTWLRLRLAGTKSNRDAEGVSRVEVKWPDGRAETFPGSPANRSLTLVEGKGSSQSSPQARRNRH